MPAFDYLIKRISYKISVVTGSTMQGIHAAAAIKFIIPRVAREDIGSGVSYAIDMGGTCEREIFYRRNILQRKRNLRLDGISATVRIINCNILIINNKCIVTLRAHESIAYMLLLDAKVSILT